MKFAHVISRITGSAWCIRDESLQAILDVVSARMQSATPMSPDPVIVPEEPRNPVEPPPGVGLVSVNGILGKHLSNLEMECGGCDLDTVQSELDHAFASPNTNAIVLDLNTPGGNVAGVPELHDRIVALRAETGKKIYAFSDVECCSGGYYLAAACDAFFATASSVVGNVGAKMVLRDISEANAKAGVKFHVFKSGEVKDIGAGYRAPTEKEAKFLQEQADLIGTEFRAAIKRQRPQAKDEALEGQPFMGSQAFAHGLVDEIVPGIDALFAQLMPETPALRG